MQQRAGSIEPQTMQKSPTFTNIKGQNIEKNPANPLRQSYQFGQIEKIENKGNELGGGANNSNRTSQQNLAVGAAAAIIGVSSSRALPSACESPVKVGRHA